MSKKSFLNTAIVIIGLLLIMLQVVISKRFSDHIGTDDKSKEIIQEIAPDYKPWFGNRVSIPLNWDETVMFAVQASIGVGVIVFYILKQRSKIKKT